LGNVAINFVFICWNVYKIVIANIQMFFV